MNDPYNTYVNYPPVAPAIPTAGTEASSAPSKSVAAEIIERIDVSESWKRRFRIIECAGGPDLPRVREAPSRDRRSVGFNFLAFLLGPFYFLAKGLWRQALLYSVLAVGAGSLLELAGLNILAKVIGAAVAVIYAMRANTSYYRKAVLGDARWF